MTSIIKYRRVHSVARSAPSKKEGIKTKVVPCVYRGEFVGKADCGCRGASEIYRCTKLVRPYSSEQAFCSPIVIGKPVVNLVDANGHVSHRAIESREIVPCRVGMCDFYKQS